MIRHLLFSWRDELEPLTGFNGATNKKERNWMKLPWQKNNQVKVI